MDDSTKEILGYWLSAIGQTMAAIATTPSTFIDTDSTSQLDLWGNVLQGTGSALIADSELEFSLEKLGNQLEAIGNLLTIMSYLAPVSDETKEKLDTAGNIVETLGVSVALPDELESGLTLSTMLDVYGHFLSIIEIKDVDENLTNMIAEWSQAIAAILDLKNVLHEANGYSAT